MKEKVGIVKYARSKVLLLEQRPNQHNMQMYVCE